MLYQLSYEATHWLSLVVIMDWLRERRFMKFDHVFVDCRHAHGWPDRYGRDRAMSSVCREMHCLGVVVEAARAFLLCLLSLSEFLLSVLSWPAAWWIVWLQATQWAARLWSMLQVLSDFFRLSLNRFFGAPLSRWSVESSPCMTILGRRQVFHSRI